MGQMIASMLAPLPDRVRTLAEEHLRATGALGEDERLEDAFQDMPGCLMGGMGCGIDCGLGCQSGLERMLAMASSERAQANAVIAMHRRMQGRV